MATRQRAQRGDDRGEFEGRVRKWKREWQPAGEGWKAKGLVFCKWIPTEERDTGAPGKRFPDINPVPTPGGKPGLPGFLRPRHAPAAVQQSMPAPMPSLKLKLSSAALTAKTGSAVGHASSGAAAAVSPPSVAPAVAGSTEQFVGVMQPPK